MSPSAKSTARIISQLAFLALFFALLLIGIIRAWVAVFVIGVIISIFLSRIYCGWMCPIGTLFRPIGWICKRLGVKRIPAPRVEKRFPLVIVVIAAFIMAMVLTQVTGLQLPIFLLILVIGVGVTLVFEEELFHKFLCPFGAILWLTSRFAPWRMNVNGDCVNCERCVGVCPNGAITTDRGGVSIVRSDCLVCFHCQDVCPRASIRYGRSDENE